MNEYHDRPLELAVLGSMMTFDAMMKEGATLEPGLFCPTSVQVLYAAQAIHNSGRAVNRFSVADALEQRGKLDELGGTVAITGIASAGVTDSKYIFGEWIDILKRKQAERAAGNVGSPVVDAYYDSTKKEFVMRNTRGVWLSHRPKEFELILKGLSLTKSKDESEGVMVGIIDTRDVAYTGRLAGYRAGFYDANGVRLLVTDGPKPIQPQPGAWPTISRLLEGLLGSDPAYGDEQMLAFCLWVASANKSIVSGEWRPGHILALAGPVGCGKSLLQRLITEILGGRSADAFRYLSGGTQFNRELFGAEHLFVDDAQASTDFRTRHQISARLKEIAVGRDHSCHGKGRDAVNLRPLWRCTISLNDEGECLLVLPPMRPDIRDKIHLLRCQSPATPFPTESPERQQQYWQTLVSELPAFIDYCRNTTVPAERKDARFGFRYFHHPALIAELESQAPELVLLELIDLCLWRSPVADSQWSGTAHNLEIVLLDSSSPVREQVKTLIKWSNATGTYLRRLADSNPARVQSDRTANSRGWIITKPREQ